MSYQIPKSYDQSLLRGVDPEPLYCPECRCSAEDCVNPEGHQDGWQTEEQRAVDEMLDAADWKIEEQE